MAEYRSTICLNTDSLKGIWVISIFHYEDESTLRINVQVFVWT